MLISTGSCHDPDELRPNPHTFFFKIHFNKLSSMLRFPFRISDCKVVCISHLPDAFFIPLHFILLHSIILIILNEEYKSRRSQLFSCLRCSVVSSLIGPKIPFSTLFSYILNLYSLLKRVTKFQIQKKQM